MGVELGLSHEAWHRWRMFGHRLLKKYFGLRGRKWHEAGEDCMMRSFITFTLH
jgi:hypothetical protein